MRRGPGGEADPGLDEALLRAYLLGTLEDPRRTEVEIRLLADGYFFEAAQALEGDLLADYAAGRLAAAEAQAVRRWLAVSAETRQRFELIQALAANAEQPSSEDRRLAPALWARIAALTPEQRRRAVEEDRALWSWVLCERACSESLKAAADDVGRALELTELALAIAERVPGNADWRARLQGFAAAFEANARRVAGDLSSAEAALARALPLWRRGAEGDPERLLAEWEVPAVEASLRREQRRFDASLEASERALSVAPTEEVASLLVRKALTYETMGDCEDAIATLRQAARSVNVRHEPRLGYCVDFNLAVNLWHLGRASDANELLPQVRKAAERLGNDLDLLRVRWLEARVAAGLGDIEQAVIDLERVRRAFEERRLAFDSALVALDLALLYRKQRRWAEIRELADQVLSTFRSQGIYREALAAVTLLVEAAEEERVSVRLIKNLQDRLRKAQPSGPSYNL